MPDCSTAARRMQIIKKIAFPQIFNELFPDVHRLWRTYQHTFCSQNIIFGIGGAVYALMGKWTLSKQRIFLYLATSVLIANVTNLVLLEIGEWHILLPENIKKLIEQGNLKTLVLYGKCLRRYTCIDTA